MREQSRGIAKARKYENTKAAGEARMPISALLLSELAVSYRPLP